MAGAFEVGPAFYDKGGSANEEGKWYQLFHSHSEERPSQHHPQSGNEIVDTICLPHLQNLPCHRNSLDFQFDHQMLLNGVPNPGVHPGPLVS
jgi:hypothetical protein